MGCLPLRLRLNVNSSTSRYRDVCTTHGSVNTSVSDSPRRPPTEISNALYRYSTAFVTFRNNSRHGVRGACVACVTAKAIVMCPVSTASVCRPGQNYFRGYNVISFCGYFSVVFFCPMKFVCIYIAMCDQVQDVYFTFVNCYNC